MGAADSNPAIPEKLNSKFPKALKIMLMEQKKSLAYSDLSGSTLDVMLALMITSFKA